MCASSQERSSSPSSVPASDAVPPGPDDLLDRISSAASNGQRLRDLIFPRSRRIEPPFVLDLPPSSRPRLSQRSRRLRNLYQRQDQIRDLRRHLAEVEWEIRRMKLDFEHLPETMQREIRRMAVLKDMHSR